MTRLPRLPRRSTVAGLLGTIACAPPTASAVSQDDILRQFHKWYYDNGTQTWRNTKWMGIPVWKMPFDMWIYQELIVEQKPDVLVECGTWKGGSALFFAHMMDPLRKGRVISVDIGAQPNLPQHPRITYLSGSSTSPDTVWKVRSLIKPGEKVMVSLDSDHVKPHVLKECQLYGPMVSVGSYLVVEDTNANGHPVLPEFGPGPMEAVQEFLRSDHRFAVDRSREKFGFTFNPSGYLKRLK